MSQSLELELPDNFYHFLKERAESNGRSLEQEAFVILSEELQKTVAAKQRRTELLDKIKDTVNKTPEAHIMSLAGSLDEETADHMLDDIKSQRTTL